VGVGVRVYDGVWVGREHVGVVGDGVMGLRVGESDRGVTVAGDSVGVIDVGVRDTVGLAVGTGVWVRVVVYVDKVRVRENDAVDVLRNDPVRVEVLLVSVIAERVKVVGVKVAGVLVTELLRVPLKEQDVVGVRVCVHVREHVCEYESVKDLQYEGERVVDQE